MKDWLKAKSDVKTPPRKSCGEATESNAAGFDKKNQCHVKV